VTTWTVVMLIVLAIAVVLMAWALWQTVSHLKRLEATKGQPDQGLLLLQGEIQASRGEARQIQADTLASVRQELYQFRTEMGRESLVGYLFVKLRCPACHTGNLSWGWLTLHRRYNNKASALSALSQQQQVTIGAGCS